jgi:1-acylglycerone phosphate reductase
MRSVLITGCSAGGIGSALAEVFQKHDLLVFATARTLSKISHLQNLPNVVLFTLDVTSPASIAAAVETVKAKTNGKLDYLVNNSGVSYVMPMIDVDIEEAKKMFDVNFWGVIAMTRAFAPLVISAKGCIIINSSISGVLVVPWMGVYGASKSALTEVSETLRLEMAPFGVSVVTIITGAVESNIMSNGPEFDLPSGSVFASVADNISALAKGKDGTAKSRMKSKDYAERVVGDILKGSTGKIWRGGMATMVRYASAYAPAFITVS